MCAHVPIHTCLHTHILHTLQLSVIKIFQVAIGKWWGDNKARWQTGLERSQSRGRQVVGFRHLLGEVWPGLADRLECEGSIKQDSQVSGFSPWVAGDAILSMVKTAEVPDLGSTVECASSELLQFEGFLWYLTCLCQTGTYKGQDTRRNVWTKDIKLKITGLRLEPLSGTRWYQPRREEENVPGQNREQFRYLEDG